MYLTWIFVSRELFRIIFDQCNTREKEMGRETDCMLWFQPGEAVLLFVTSQWVHVEMRASS